MLIECYYCSARVDAKPVGMVEEDDWGKSRVYLLTCPSCLHAVVGESVEKAENQWSELVRVYPKPRRPLGGGVPEMVQHSLEEAERCMQVGAFLAAAAMAGRSLEAICRHFGTKDTYLGAGIKELREKGVIDARLYEWSEELRDQRNDAAHATDAKFSARDAEDILAFTYAIADYVFLLAQKFEQFKKRRKGAGLPRNT